MFRGISKNQHEVEKVWEGKGGRGPLFVVLRSGGLSASSRRKSVALPPGAEEMGRLPQTSKASDAAEEGILWKEKEGRLNRGRNKRTKAVEVAASQRARKK